MYFPALKSFASTPCSLSHLALRLSHCKSNMSKKALHIHHRTDQRVETSVGREQNGDECWRVKKQRINKHYPCVTWQHGGQPVVLLLGQRWSSFLLSIRHCFCLILYTWPVKIYKFHLCLHTGSFREGTQRNRMTRSESWESCEVRACRHSTKRKVIKVTFKTVTRMRPAVQNPIKNKPLYRKNLKWKRKYPTVVIKVYLSV